MSQSSFTHSYMAPVAPIFTTSSPAGVYSATSGNIKASKFGSPFGLQVRDSGISTFTPVPSPTTTPDGGGASNIERDGNNSAPCLPVPNLSALSKDVGRNLKLAGSRLPSVNPLGNSGVCALDSTKPPPGLMNRSQSTTATLPHLMTTGASSSRQSSLGGQPGVCSAYSSDGVCGGARNDNSRVLRQASSNPARLNNTSLAKDPSLPTNSTSAIRHSSFVNSNCGRNDLSGSTEHHSISEHTLVSQDDSHGSCPNLCSSLLGGCSRAGFSPQIRGQAEHPVAVSKGRDHSQGDKTLSEKRSTRVKPTKHSLQQKTAASLPPNAKGDITSTSAAKGPEQNQDRQEVVGGVESGDEHEASCCGCGFLKWVKRLFTKQSSAAQ